MYLVFTRTPGESYGSLLYMRYVFRALITTGESYRRQFRSVLVTVFRALIKLTPLCVDFEVRED